MAPERHPSVTAVSLDTVLALGKAAGVIPFGVRVIFSVDHALRAVAAAFGPFIVLLGEDGADQAGHAGGCQPRSSTRTARLMPPVRRGAAHAGVPDRDLDTQVRAQPGTKHGLSDTDASG